MALSPAGAQLFGNGGSPYGLGDVLRDQIIDETEELKKERQAQFAGRPAAGVGLGVTPLSLAFPMPTR
jgi:hypothetical protein